MPTPVRRSVFVASVAFALVLAGTAFAGNGGLAPPSPASPNAANIRDIYWLILAVSAGIFVLVAGLLLLFIVRYRSRGRPREVEGPQVRGHTNLELAWTAGPVVILAVITGFVFWKVSDIGATSGLPNEQSQAREQTTVDAHQFYWEFVYPNGAISVDHLRMPYNRTVRLRIISSDVAHSWWIPTLGTFRGQCAELCGVQHAAMLAEVDVLPAAEYDSWVQGRLDDRAALGKETFEGVCAKCHGLAAQGGIGPNIAASALLNDPRALAKVIREGTGKMPAVGDDWPQEQMAATIAYLQQRFGQGGGTGGGQG
jgi:cytochrome c oxidase subunit II